VNEQQALAKMIAPGTRRPGKYREGVIQIWATRACDKSCFGCTQGSNLAGNPGMITMPQFEQAVLSLSGYFGVVGLFGGNPAMHPNFTELCEILRKHVPYEQRGIWCNNPLTPEKAQAMRETFNPAVSNLNVHLDQKAFDLFARYWPEARPVGLERDSRHAPCYVAMKDVIEDEGERWELISDCDINKHWSAMIGVFRGEVRAWFCEIAGAQAMLHQDEPDYPDTGLDPTQLYCDAPREKVMVNTPSVPWWKLGMWGFTNQVRKHCHSCSVPLKGYGELAQAPEDSGVEQVSQTHANIFNPKRKTRRVELVTVRSQLDEGKLTKMTDYLGNSSK
jgi:hypothetical protein